MSQPQERATLAALLFGNFVIGTGILLPAGMLGALADSLDVSVANAGLLILASGVVVAVGAPALAGLTSAYDRRYLLASSMGLYVVCHLASAAAPNFEVLVALRLVMAVSAALFTPQAAATLGAMLPPERRAQAITLIFIGWSFATVGGVPLGGLVADTLSWRVAYLIVAALSLIALVAVWLTVPPKIHIAPLNAASWRAVATSPALLLVILVTVLNGTGQFTFFTYLKPSIIQSLTAGTAIVTALLAWYGVCATVGNVMVTRLVARTGPARSALITLLVMSVGLALWGAGATSLPVIVFAAAVWGFGTFAANSVQQARLAGIRPELASASIALNTSAIYLGQAAGSGLGATLIHGGLIGQLPWVAATILLLAALVSHRAQRYERAEVVAVPPP